MPTPEQDLEMARDPRSSRKVARVYGVEKTYVLARRAQHCPDRVWPTNGVSEEQAENRRLRFEVARLQSENAFLRDGIKRLAKQIDDVLDD